MFSLHNFFFHKMTQHFSFSQLNLTILNFTDHKSSLNQESAGNWRKQNATAIVNILSVQNIFTQMISVIMLI